MARDGKASRESGAGRESRRVSSGLCRPGPGEAGATGATGREVCQDEFTQALSSKNMADFGAREEQSKRQSMAGKRCLASRAQAPQRRRAQAWLCEAARWMPPMPMYRRSGSGSHGASCGQEAACLAAAQGAAGGTFVRPGRAGRRARACGRGRCGRSSGGRELDGTGC